MSDKTHRILIVGTGSIGERHARCFLATGRAEVGLCEPNDAVREPVAKRYPAAGSFASLAAALRECWDAAVIAVPAHLHIPLATRVAEAGVAPLIEKPLALVPDGLSQLENILTQQNLPCGVAYVYRAHPALAAMRRAIIEGRFGGPVQLVVTGGQHFPAYRPAYASTYYADHARGGGAIHDVLTHLVNAGEWLVGPMTRVVADAAHLCLPGVTVEDTVNALARHGDVLGSYSLNQHQAPNEITFTLACEEGTARLELARHTWRWMKTPDTPWEEHRAAIEERDEWFTRQGIAWLDVLDGQAQPLCSLDEGAQTMRATQAIWHSATKQSGWVDVPQELAV